MNSLTPIVLISLIVPGVVFLLLPYITPRRYFFGITVERGFAQSPAGRAIHRMYSLTVAAALVVAIVLAMLLPQTMLVDVFLPLVVAIVALFHARSQALHHAAPRVHPATNLSPDREPLPRWSLLALLPFAALVAVGNYLRAHWDEIPERFPVHWGAGGQPNRWASRTPHGVYGPLWFGAGMMALLIFLGVVTFYGSRRSPMRAGVLKIMVAVIYLLACVFGAVALLPLNHFSPLALAIPLPLFIIAVLAYSAKLSSDTDTAAPADETPDACWRGSSVYYNPADPALFVPKRFGVGYTFNFANPFSWVVLGVVVVAIPGLILLVR